MMKLSKILLLFFSATICIAEEVQQGKIYPSGAFVESRETGIGLTIPQGWQGAWPAGAEMFVLESTNLKANIFMAMQPADEKGLQQWMASSIQLDASTKLQPVGTTKKIDKVYSARFTVDNAPQLSAFVVAQIIPPSTGLAFIALSADSSKTSQVEQITRKLANTLTIKPANIQATNRSSSTGNGFWNDYFKGGHIVRYFTGSDYTEEQHLWLCSDGRFQYKFSSGGFSMSGASGASSSLSEGNWSASGDTASEGQLILRYSSGKQRTYRVSKGKELQLNGKKWIPTNNKICS